MRKLTKDEQKAVEVVNELISDYRTVLEGITLVKDEYEQDPILVEGETTKGFPCHLMVEPKEVANIILEYDYPVYKVLGEEAPQAMWDRLAARFGLYAVTGFDL